MAVRRETLLNNATTTVNEALDNSETVITMTDGSVFPAKGECRFIIDDERFLMQSRSGNDVTAVRGIEGSSAVTHLSGADVKIIMTSGAWKEFINDSFGVGPIAQGGAEHRYPFRLLDESNVTLSASDFTWVNQGSSSVADDPWGGLTVTVVEATGDWKLLHRAIPTVPYTITTNVMFGPGLAFGASGSLMGVGFRESSTGKFVIAALEVGDTNNFWRFTDPATFSAAATTNNPFEMEWDQLWVQVEDDNTDLKARMSMDGITWYELGVDGRTAFMSGGANQICWAFNPRGSASKLMHLRSWVEEEN